MHKSHLIVYWMGNVIAIESIWNVEKPLKFCTVSCMAKPFHVWHTTTNLQNDHFARQSIQPATFCVLFIQKAQTLWLPFLLHPSGCNPDCAANTLTKRLPLLCHLMRNNVRNCSRSTIMCYSKHKTSSNKRARWIVCRDQTSKRFEESIMLWIEWRCCRFTFPSIVRTQCVGFIVRSVISTELSCDHLCQSVSRCLCVIFIITCICNRTFVAFFLTDT